MFRRMIGLSCLSFVFGIPALALAQNSTTAADTQARIAALVEQALHNQQAATANAQSACAQRLDADLRASCMNRELRLTVQYSRKRL